ncbi:amidohydrolase family protein [Streptococcus dysgalactiae]|uniref:amidohydrolase family protein n=1 Tax=Streptococcus dysgalactiae TaxID=1334 RepID=UPI003FD7EB1E
MTQTAIDTHAHLWSDEYLDLLESLGGKGIAIAKGLNASEEPQDLAKRLDMMDKAGVDYQVLSAMPQVPQFGKPQEALAAAEMINNFYHTIIDQHPDRFRAYGVVPLPHVQEAIQEGKRIIEELGFLGIAVNTVLETGQSIADDAFLPFFEAMDALGAIIYIHPTGCEALSPMVNDYDQEWVVGEPIEDMLATLQLLKREFPQKFPHLGFHIAHLGGGISFQMQRILDNYEDWRSFSYHPLETLQKHFWFDTANFLEASLSSIVTRF